MFVFPVTMMQQWCVPIENLNVIPQTGTNNQDDIPMDTKADKWTTMDVWYIRVKFY